LAILPSGYGTSTSWENLLQIKNSNQKQLLQNIRFAALRTDLVANIFIEQNLIIQIAKKMNPDLVIGILTASYDDQIP
jgi:hypothetical protein